MDKKFRSIRMLLLGLVVLEALLLLIGYFIFKLDIIMPILFVIANTILLFFMVSYFNEETKENLIKISDIVGDEAGEAFSYGKIGLLTYDEDYIIDWCSDLFYERGIDRVSVKVLQWLPEANQLFKGDTDKIHIKIDEYWYEIVRKDNSQVLIFKDVTNERKLKFAYEQEKLVLGLIHLDNYNESTQYSEESEISSIDTKVRQPIVEWCRKYGVIMKRLRADRYFLVLNEEIYDQLVKDRFSILRDTRRASLDLDVSITLSMAFSRGTNDFEELDDMCISSLSLAQSRGGDQVVINVKGEDIKYYGGSSEALEKRSRVRVRVMANTLRELILKSSNVIICGHKEADFDCIGAAMCMSRIAEAYNRQVCIIARTGGLEAKVSDALKENEAHLKERHLFVSESEAINQLQDDTLVIMVDHHKVSTSNGSSVLEKAKKVAIFDHHRRSADLEIDPILIYIEAGASSCCELVAEFVPYLSNNVEIDEVEATFMLAGILIDTNRFTTRTGVRTFDAASLIRAWGSDPIQADQYLKDDFDEFEMKIDITKYSKRYDHGVVIAAVDEKETPTRSIMSQAADQILRVKEVEAVFVICKTNDGSFAISSRSRGKINVQSIMEQMKGGGHFTAAALQRENSSVNDLQEELLDVLDKYFEEVSESESNTVE